MQSIHVAHCVLRTCTHHIAIVEIHVPVVDWGALSTDAWAHLYLRKEAASAGIHIELEVKYPDQRQQEEGVQSMAM